MRLISFFLFFTGTLYSVAADAKWYSRSFEVMGTQAKVDLEWGVESEAQLLVEQVISEMQRIDALMSSYKASSELSLINLRAGIKPLKISQEMFDLIEKSLSFSKMTDGAFDISYSSVGYLYNYRKKLKPDQQQLSQLKDAINYRRIILDKVHSTVFFEDKRVKIDLGGIAKGHAVDRCIELLRLAGVKNAYVNAGGDSRLIGRKENRLWYIGVRHPRDESKLLANLPLEEIALSTSGDYERFFIEDGIRYHHIINPETGMSVKSTQSATILANDSTTADALSTSIFVLGVKKGMALINQLPEISAIMVDHNGKLFVSNDIASTE